MGRGHERAHDLRWVHDNEGPLPRGAAARSHHDLALVMKL